jgi:hypothetical protein
MWIVIDGTAGSGKTFLQTKLIYKQWKKGAKVWANYKLHFPKDNEDVHRFYLIDETYHLTDAVLGFDEIQDLVGHWMAMPILFRNKIAHHRHNFLLVICNTQDFNDLHVELRRNVHERYRCQNLLRIPFNDNVKPIFQWIIVVHKVRKISNNNDDIRFVQKGWPKFYFISRYWTRVLYDTHANIDFNRFLCKLEYEKKGTAKKGSWTAKIYSRDLVSRGKARL